jgi:hypothetical protein
MRTADLTPEEIDDIDRVAVLIYRSTPGGASAVHDFAKLLNWEEYGHCEPCDEITPLLDKLCLVCGDINPHLIPEN